MQRKDLMSGNRVNAYLRTRIYKIEEILPFVVLEGERSFPKLPSCLIAEECSLCPPVQNKASEVVFDGKIVKMTSKRLRTFATKGLVCAECKIVGQYFALERHKVLAEHSDPNVWHFNLYAIDAEGIEVLMTRDHIVPVSKGGSDSLKNSQTMCARCNNKKGNHFNG